MSAELLDVERREVGWLIRAHRLLLEVRHEQAHNGDLVRLGTFEKCLICGPELVRAARLDSRSPTEVYDNAETRDASPEDIR